MRAFPFLIVFAALSSCGGTEVVVKGQPCTGCRDARGACVVGDQPTACGASGAACEACASQLVCRAGACVSPNDGVDAGRADAGADGCAAEAKLVYVVDTNRTLSSFDPTLVGTGNPFVDLGHLSCPATSGAEPFSMSVDRNATAWIIYDSGELFTVNVRQAPLTCVKTSFAPHNNVAKFGMGFVSNAAGSTDETLFISGSDFGAGLDTTKFGTLKTSPPYTLALLGTLTGAPEISGTGDGKLWAFFPNVTPPKVSQLSKTNGLALSSFEAPTLAGAPRAWAFAFWGGDFFIFLERDSDVSTNVWKMDGATGAVTNVVPSSGRRIVGAGVSTCAPVEIN